MEGFLDKAVLGLLLFTIFCCVTILGVAIYYAPFFGLLLFIGIPLVLCIAYVIGWIAQKIGKWFDK